MSEASVKGTIFLNVVNDINQLLDEGKLRPDDLRECLKPEEIEQLDHEIAISTWYSADTYCRMLGLMARSASGREREFLIEGGRTSARRVIDLGLYGQLDERTEGHWADRIGRILTTLSGSFFNFGRWEWMGLEGEGFGIHVHHAGPFSTELALRTQGFIEVLASRAAEGRVLVSHEFQNGGSDLHYRARRVG